MGYAVESGGLTEWAVALPCGMAALLTPFPVVPWRDMVTVQEANLGWVCTWHTHLAGRDPRKWQAKVVMTYLSWSLPAAPGAWARWWDRALSCSYGYSNPMGYQTSDFRLLWTIPTNPQPPKPPMIDLCPPPPQIRLVPCPPYQTCPPPPLFLLPNSAPCFLCRP